MARQLKEEKDREQAFEKRMEEMSKYGAKFAEEGAGKKKKEQEQELERILLRDQMAKLQADVDKEQAKEAKRRSDIKKTIAWNERIINRKKEDAEKQAEEDHKFQEYFKAELDNWRQTEAGKIEAKKEKNRQYKAILDDHCAIRSSKDVNLTGMGDTELEINGQMLRKVTEDKSLYNRIQDKLTGRDVPPMSKKAKAQQSRRPY